MFQRGLQFQHLDCDESQSFGSGRFRRAVFFGQGFDGFRGEQLALFQQAAEIFFAGMAVFAFAGMEILEDFIRDFQSFEVNDADVFVAMFPDLALLEFKRHENLREPRLSGY